MEYSVLLFVHVISAILWGGAVILVGFWLIPAVLEAGPGGGAVMGGIMKRKYALFMTLAGVLSMLSGLRLYAIRFSSAWVQTPEGIVLTLGGLLALSAFFMGALKQRPLAEKMGALAQAGKFAEIPPVAAKLKKTAQVVAWHVVAVIILMAGHGIAAAL